MILPILGLGGTIILTLINMWSFVTEWSGIKAIILGGTDRLDALRVPVGLSAAGGIYIILLAVLCLYRIFTYSPSVPKLMTAFYILLVVDTFGEMVADKMISITTGELEEPSNLPQLLRTIVSAAIWIPYFRISRRVANTFRTREAETDKKIGYIFA